MKKSRCGFTLIEVAIFLAVTGALFAAITIGVQNSIYQQRYNDTVQSFENFLGDLYSEVVNVQSTGDGRSEDAVYGKLVTFGDYGREEDYVPEQQVIHTYDVIARAVNSWDIGNRSTLSLLRDDSMRTNVLHKNEAGEYVPVGVIEDYTPKWAARIEKKDEFQDFVGSLLIVRNAQTGIVRTYVSDVAVPVQEVLNGSMSGEHSVFKKGDEGSYLDGFEAKQVDFCVNPNGNEPTNTRMDVRIVKDAHDVSGIEMISFDNEGYACKVSE